jgi:hypothetical protein
MEEKRPLTIPWLRSMDNIKIYLKEMLGGDLNWINLSQDRDQWRILVNTATKLRHQKTGDFLSSYSLSQASQEGFVFVKLLISSFCSSDCCDLNI